MVWFFSCIILSGAIDLKKSFNLKEKKMVLVKQGHTTICSITGTNWAL